MSDTDNTVVVSDEHFPYRMIFLKGLIAPVVYYRNVLRVAWPYLVLFLFVTLMDGIDETETSFFGEFLTTGAALFMVLAVVAAAVGCHRVFILGPDSVKQRAWYSFGKSELRYIGWWIVIALVSGLFVVPFALVATFTIEAWLSGDSEGRAYLWISLIGAQIPMAYFFARLALLLPAAATNFLPHLNLGWAWRLSRQYQLGLFVVLGLLPIATTFVLQTLPVLGEFEYPSVVHLVWLYVAVAELAMLSFSFEHLTRADAPDAVPQANV